MDGEGHVTYFSGATYEGQLAEGAYHGKGVLRAIDGRETDGRFVGGRACGCASPRPSPSRTVFPGVPVWIPPRRVPLVSALVSTHPVSLEFGCRFASLLLPSGDLYEGELHNDERHGEGRCTYANGDVYFGSWVHGQRHARDGTITYARGGSYAGGWARDQREGDGSLTLPDGRVANGMWAEGALVGEATLQLPSGGWCAPLPAAS